MKIMASQLPEWARGYIIEKTAELMPILHGDEWQLLEDMANGIHARSKDGIEVIAEVEMVSSTDPAASKSVALTPWIHVSFSRCDRMPSYEDMARVKRRFIGRKRKGIMVLPSELEHYNYHPNCLHLFSPLLADPLPDFRAEGGGL
jgi:hypothetical protein